MKYFKGNIKFFDGTEIPKKEINTFKGRMLYYILCGILNEEVRKSLKSFLSQGNVALCASKNEGVYFKMLKQKGELVIMFFPGNIIADWNRERKINKLDKTNQNFIINLIVLEVLTHEGVHLEQVRDGDLELANEHRGVIWKGNPLEEIVKTLRYPLLETEYEQEAYYASFKAIQKLGVNVTWELYLEKLKEIMELKGLTNDKLAA